MELLGQDFVIKNAVIISDKVVNVDLNNRLNVTPIILELILSEGINRPFITGKIALHDSSGMIRALNLKGSERIELTLGAAEKKGITPITRTFLIDSVELVQKSESYLIDIIDEGGYKAVTGQISRSYVDKIPNIIDSICRNVIGDPVHDMFGSIDKSLPRTNVIIPYLNTQDAVGWLLKRYTTKTGMPNFITKSLYNNKLYLFDLESSLKSTAFNVDYPFIKSDAHMNYSTSAELINTEAGYTSIGAYLEQQTDSMLTLARESILGVKTITVDTNNNLYESLVYSINKPIKYTSREGLLKYQDIIDNSFMLDDVNQIEYPSAKLTKPISSNTYLGARGILDGVSEAGRNNYTSRDMMADVMIQKTITMELNGTLFAANNVSVGQKMTALFESNEKIVDSKDQVYDEKLSGDYIITNINHKFNGTQYNVVVDGVKMGLYNG